MNYPIKQAHEYYKRLGVSVDNYQKIFGIEVEIWRSVDRETNDSLRAYGRSQTIPMSKNHKVVSHSRLLVTPQEMYDVYSQGSGSELTVITHKKDFLVGDIIKYNWINNIILEFSVQEDPKTYLDIYFQYTLKSMYQINNK